MRTVQNEDVRPTVVAGHFYPSDRDLLEQELDELISAVPPGHVEGQIKALISPHAGYVYSGRIAATGYRQVQDDKFDVVAVIAPSHHDSFPGASVFTGKAFATPLGLLEVAQELALELSTHHECIRSSWLGHRREHALEVQLPFIQKVLPSARIIPIAMGRQDYEMCEILGDALGKVLAPTRALVVATSDLSHFHSYDEATVMDSHTSFLIERFDAMSLREAILGGECEACGVGPIMTAMLASKWLGADAAKVLSYCNSGDISGDYRRVVGYLAAVFYDMN